ncbi:unnamed protein product [Polarella glacialis]|uniref:Uncharacterized protein n=1 Tax=Polarella glacialis TaxID=89957 RepID=A0A813JRK6_POLGL|nr:unnamed protein product [Polarella glacialis]
MQSPRPDLTSLRGAAAAFQAGGAAASQLRAQAATARRLVSCGRASRRRSHEEDEEDVIEASLASTALRSLGALPRAAERALARRQEVPAGRSLRRLALRNSKPRRSADATLIGSPWGARIHDQALEISSSIGFAFVRQAMEEGSGQGMAGCTSGALTLPDVRETAATKGAPYADKS